MCGYSGVPVLFLQYACLAFGTEPHALHKIRRTPLNPFFSKRSVVAFQPKIQEMVEDLCIGLKGCIKRDEVVHLRVAFLSLTLDVICTYGQTVLLERKSHESTDKYNSIWRVFGRSEAAWVFPTVECRHSRNCRICTRDQTVLWYSAILAKDTSSGYQILTP